MNTNLYKTTSLTFSAWLLSTKRMTFKGSEAPKGNSRSVAFVFEDPADEGDALYAEFLGGPFNAFYESVKNLRRVIDARAPNY